MANAAKTSEAPKFEGFDPDLVNELEPKLMNLMQQSEALVALMRDFFHKLDKKRSEEFKIIAGYISKAKEEIREMRPHDISNERIPTAGAELEAITRDTENATHTIMNAAEAIMSLDNSDADTYKTAVDDEVMKIFEACSFQDITGQRVTKVINVLKQIEERVGKLANALGVEDQTEVVLTPAEIRARDLLLHGPAINGPEVKQDAIDVLFGAGDEADSFDFAPVAPLSKPEIKEQVTPLPKVETPAVARQETFDAPASQDDIDALFDAVSGEEAELDMGKLNSQDDIDALFG